MIYAFDTFYYENKANTACVGFNNWNDERPSFQISDLLDIEVKAYVSGEFYKRELPCLLSILNKIQFTEDDTLVIDGYVTLNASDKKGLGGYLYEKLNRTIPVIGIAKNAFAEDNASCYSILRGNSKKPLFITALGTSVSDAAKQIGSMHGDFRIPTLLKIVDQLSRK